MAAAGLRGGRPAVRVLAQGRSLMRMRPHRERHPEYNVVMQCPGCELWQVDYTDEVAASFAELRMEHIEIIEELSGEVTRHDQPAVDTSPFYEAVEHILNEHMQECVHLQRLVDEL